MKADRRKLYLIIAVVVLLVAAAAAVIAGAYSEGKKEKAMEGENTMVLQNEAEADKSSTDETSTDDTAILSEGYHLVWEDDFDDAELNMNDWNYEYHEPGWVNNELQEYVDAKENIFIKDGNLVLKAIKTETDGEISYTSGRVNTQNKHDFKYGRFEARLKVPSGKGFLPAFWMMPTDENLYGQWPKCGEIDIMEVLGDQLMTNYGTIHYGEPHAQSQESYSLQTGDFASEYHVFACEWEPGEIRYYVDGQLYYTVNDWFSKKEGYGEVTYPAPFDQPFYIILNVAVGGNWPGDPAPDAVFEENAEMWVDYVRVYQKDAYDENVVRPTKNTVIRSEDETGNYVLNSDFSQDMDADKDWSFLLASTGKATAEVKDNELHIATTNAGDLDYSVQVVQARMPMLQGGIYRFSFDAYASQPRTMIAAITAPDNNWIRYFADTAVELTTEKQNFSFEFDMLERDDTNGRVEFNLGNQPSLADVYITNVRLEKIGESEIPQKAQTILPDGNYIYNGGFQEGSDRMDYWEVESLCEGAEVSVTNTDNIRELWAAVPDTATGETPVIVKQDNVSISTGKVYILSFEAYADSENQMSAVIADQSFDVSLTTEKSEYKYSFEVQEEAESKALQFVMGTAGNIYIDNVRIQEDSMLINGDFSDGLTGYEVYSYTEGDVSYVVDSLNEDYAFSIDISNTGNTDWAIQLKQNHIKLEKGKWYRLTLDAKSTMERKMMYALQRDGSADDDWTAYSGSQIVDLSNDYQTFTTVFEMTSDTDEDTILSISMGAVDAVEISQKHTVCIDNIKLEEVEAP